MNGMWIVLSTFLAVAPPAAAGTRSFEIQEIARLSPSDAGDGFGEAFGTSVAIDGDWIVVGAPGDDQFADGSGAAYVYRRQGTTWVEHTKLKGLPLWHDQMGHSVGIDGDWIVAGAPNLGGPGWCIGGVGRAYLFRRDDWHIPDDPSDDRWDLAAILNPRPSDLWGGFGFSVDISGDIAVVGMLPCYSDVGRAYAFRWTGTEWLPDGVLIGSDTQAGDSFGYSVATNGEQVMVGAYGEGYPCPGYERCWGAVYVFGRDSQSWVQETKLVASDDTGFGLFGVHGSFLLVGTGTGVYSYRTEGTGWVREGKLSAEDQFWAGAAALAENLALIGDPYHGTAGAYSGVGYLFRRVRGTWIYEARLIASDASEDDWFGYSVAVGDRYAVIDAIAPQPTYVLAVGEPLSLRDYGMFQSCFRAESPLPSACVPYDAEPDGRIDLADHALLLQTLRGP